MSYSWMPLLQAVNSGKVFGDKGADRWVATLQILPTLSDIDDRSKVYTLVPSGQFANVTGLGTYAKLLMFEHGIALLILFDSQPPGGPREQAMFWPDDRLTGVVGEKKLLQGQVIVEYTQEDGSQGSQLVGMINPKGAATEFANAARRHFGL